MHVPVELRAFTKLGVDAWEEVAGQQWGEVAACEVVEQGCEEEFVDVEGEGGEVEAGRERLGRFDEEGGWGEGERVVHVWLEEWEDGGGGADMLGGR